MLQQIRFEFKRALHSPLYYLFFVLLVAGLFHFATPPSFKASFAQTDVQIQSLIDWTQTNYQYYEEALQDPDSGLSKVQKETYQQKVATGKEFIAVLKTHDGLKINQAILHTIKTDPNNILPLDASPSNKQLYEYLVKHQVAENSAISHYRAFNMLFSRLDENTTITKTLTPDPKTSAYSPMPSAQTMIEVEASAPTNYVYLLFIGIIVLVTLAFTAERRSHTDAFRNIVPLSHGKVLFAKAFTASVLCFSCYLLSLVSYVLIIGLNSDYGFGDLHYGFAYQLFNQVVIFSLGKIFLEYSGFILLWVLFFVCFTTLVSLLFKNPLIIILCSSFFLLLRQTGLLTLKPLLAITKFIPSKYLLITNLIQGRCTLSGIHQSFAAAVLITWSLVFIAISMSIVRKRRYL